jgi:hypothetical protein
VTLTCDEVADLLRKAAGSYDKTRVYTLQINDEKVAAAVKRASDKHPSLEEIPTLPQTAIHLILQSLVARKIISVRAAPETAARVGGKKKSKGTKK